MNYKDSLDTHLTLLSDLTKDALKALESEGIEWRPPLADVADITSAVFNAMANIVALSPVLATRGLNEDLRSKMLHAHTHYIADVRHAISLLGTMVAVSEESAKLGASLTSALEDAIKGATEEVPEVPVKVPLPKDQN